MTVAVAYNNHVHADDAADFLGCSYSHLVNLLKSKKIKGQKIEGRWMVDYPDLQKAKSMHMVRPRGPIVKKPASISRPVVEETEIRLTIPKHKFELIRTVFERSPDKSLIKFLNKQVDGLYQEISEKLSSISVG